MRLASFVAEGRQRFGLSPDQQRLYDLTELFQRFLPQQDAPRTMLELIEGGASAWQCVQELQQQIARHDGQLRHFSVDAVQFLAPITRPSKICCIALNNSANADRVLRGPKHPASFLKAANSLVGHGGDIQCKRSYGRVHPEPELAVVVGREAKDVAAADAYEYVFGYTAHNDITSPTMRAEDTFHYRAIHPKNGNAGEIEYLDTWTSYTGRYKASDTFSSMGPWLVTREDVPDPHNLVIECRQDGELVTSDNTANLSHKVPEVLSFLSSYMTLLPGDIISMGTALKAAGGGGRAVQNIPLQVPGTRVSVSIERIGTLENTSRLVG